MPRFKEQYSAESSFQRPAILGANVFSAQIAALFANTGIHVWLYDKPSLEQGDPNSLARKILDERYGNQPSSFLGPEVGVCIEARNYRDHWSLLSEHDLVIDCLPDDLKQKQGLWSRLSPALAKDAVVLSHSAWLSMADISQAIIPALRPRFMGVHFFRPPCFQRLVEIVPTRFSDAQLVEKVHHYFTQQFGFAAFEAPDTPNYISTRLVNALINIAFYHADKLTIALGEFELLTQLLTGRPIGGLCHLLDYIGLDRAWHCHPLAEEQAYFGERLNTPILLAQLLAAGRNGRDTLHGFYNYHYKPHILQDITGNPCPSSALDTALHLAIKQRHWPELCALAKHNKQAQFAYCVLRDWWQYGIYLSRCHNLEPTILDILLKRGFSWQSGLYQLLQDFGAAQVSKTLDTERDNHATGYPLLSFSPLWKRRPPTQIQPLNPFVKEARILCQRDGSTTWAYRDAMLIWQPKQTEVAFNTPLLNEILETCQKARRAQQYLLIYHHGECFGQVDDIHLSIQANTKLNEVLSALRIHPRAVMFSLSGMIRDLGAALLMQADQLLLDTNTQWQLSSSAHGLPPCGAVWFEWLRRLPYLSRNCYLEQIHTILCRAVQIQPLGDVYTARNLGILRMHDRILNSKQQLAQVTRELADTWLSYPHPRIMRHAQYQLLPQDVASLEQRANESEQPSLYRELLALITGQQHNMSVSLRMLLEHEQKLRLRLQGLGQGLHL